MTKRQGPLDELLIGLVRNGYDEVLCEIPLERWDVIDNTDLTIEETVEQVVHSHAELDARRQLPL